MAGGGEGLAGVVEKGDGAGALSACTLPESDNMKTKNARTTSLCIIVILYDESEVEMFGLDLSVCCVLSISSEK